jgi:hypothetical protein
MRKDRQQINVRAARQKSVKLFFFVPKVVPKTYVAPIAEEMLTGSVDSM